MASVLRSLRLPLSLSRSFPKTPLRVLPTNFARARLFASTPIRSDRHDVGHGGPPQLYGPGGKAGEVPTDEEQATGLERLELLGDLMGIDVFDNKPIDMSRMGTLDEPIPIFSLASVRYIGCTGFPADSHDTIWMKLEHKEMMKRPCRCQECGCVYEMNFQGDKAQLDPHYEEHH